jgi:heme A synthase
MKLILRFVHLSSLTVWFGGVLFLSFFIAPVMFKTFPVDRAGEIMNAIFPLYYLMGILAGFLALISLFLLSKKKPWFRLSLIAVMLVATLYGGLVAGKKAGLLRLEMKETKDQLRLTLLKNDFHSQHRLSMISNGMVLFLIPVVVLLTARNLNDA